MPRPLALITGGTSGIGFATAAKLVGHYDLALVFLQDKKKAELAKASLHQMEPSAEIHLFPAELNGHESCKKIYQEILTETKKDPAVLVHSAGRIRRNFFIVADFLEIEAMIQEHLLSALSLTQMLLPAMYRNKFGRIVFIGSTAANRPQAGQASYAAAKAALEGFTKALSLEVAHRGVTVNCVTPGLIDTPLAAETIAKLSDKKAAAGRAEDVGNLVAFLCSEEAAHLSGGVFPLDGRHPPKISDE